MEVAGGRPGGFDVAVAHLREFCVSVLSPGTWTALPCSCMERWEHNITLW